MATLQEHSDYRPNKARAKKLSIHIDMAPMVDLAFLLLTFFVLTAVFQTPKSMELTFPAEGEPAPIKNGITFLLGDKDRIFYYEGEMRPGNTKGKSKTQLRELSFSPGTNSLHKFLLEKNKSLHKQLKEIVHRRTINEIDEGTFKKLSREKKTAKEQFTYVIKAGKDATYKNVVDVIDELNINMIGKYVVTDILPSEINLMNESSQMVVLK